MAGVKPVEYIKDSSTTGFAVAGDQKPITDNNANTIKKDVDQGNTKKLDNGQTKFLEGRVDEDTIDYSNDEMKNVGKNQIDTKGTENTDAGNAAGTTAGMVGLATLQVYLGKLLAATNGWTAPLIGAAYVAEGVLTQKLVKAFDDQYDNRVKQLEAKDNTNQTIQNYFDLMTSDMDTMVEDAEKYKALSDSKLASDIERMTQIGVLQGQIASLQEQGNLEKVAELQAQLDELTQEGEKDPTGAMLGDLEKGLETYSGNSAEASGVAESGDVVSEFLGDGKTMGILAQVNALILTAGALMGVVIAAKGIAKSGIWSKIPALIGAAICLGGIYLYTQAALDMKKKGSNEFKCADAGSEMDKKVKDLRSNVEQQTGFTETTGAGYTKITTENAETTKKVQDGINKANKNNPTQPTGSNPTTPTNGNGNGDGNGEKPKEPTAPEGAAA